MLGKLRDFYLNQAQHSIRAAHDLLLAEIAAKQKAWGIAHIYDRSTLRRRTSMGQWRSRIDQRRLRVYGPSESEAREIARQELSYNGRAG